MAAANGYGTGQDMSQGTISPPAVFAMPGWAWNAVPNGVAVLTQQGSNAGVPGGTIASDGGGTQAAAQFGATAVSRGVLGQPIFWAFVLMAIAVAGFAHLAHHSMRG
jgi:hypothetical protein